MSALFKKIERLAKDIESDGKRLDFVALIHRVDAPGGWDLVILTPDLPPRSGTAIDYVFHHLERVLTLKERLEILRVVVRAPDHRVINDLLDSGQLAVGRVVRLNDENFDRAYVVLSRKPLAKAG